MKYRHASAMIIAAAGFAGCIAPTSSTGEEVGHSSEAVSTGMSASLSVSNGGSVLNVTATVTNGTPNPASNWQVAINLNGTTLNQSVNGSAEVNMIGGVPVFSPNVNAQSALAPGASTQFSFSVTPHTGSSYPTVATVDGESNGASGAGELAMNTDQVAQAAATGALAIAMAYENNKLANNGDANYAQYDSLIWDAHSYAISGNTIVFDSTVPGYAFIPNQAKAELAFAQMDASVASYLVNGLQSCLNDTSGQMVFNFRAGVLQGFKAGSTSTGTLGGVLPPIAIPNVSGAAWTPSGYNVNSVVDTYSTTMLKGTNVISATLTGTRSPASEQDYWFGMLTSTTFQSFNNTAANLAKYGAHPSGNQQACSPFNGPGGGTTNPSFTISLNGQKVAARFQGVGTQCQNGCTSTITVDPCLYTLAGAQDDQLGVLLGPNSNPFNFNQKAQYSVQDHSNAAVANPAIPTDPTYDYGIQTANGVQTVGTFSNAVTLFGVTKWQFTTD